MKILEVAPEFLPNEAGVLMTILQHLTARTPGGTRVPTPNVLKLMANAGYNLNYYELDALIKSDESLRNQISNYDAVSMTVGKEAPEPEEAGAEPDQDPRNIEQPNTDEKSLNTVDKMAKSAIR